MNLSEFKKLPLLGILRGIDIEMIEPIADIVRDAGLQTVEITMNTPNATQLIGAMVKEANRDFIVGAGTVITVDDLHRAIEAGASFIVTPGINPEVIEICKKHKIFIFTGALTPTEVMTAGMLGASMVKVFPANVFGASYIKDLKGPLNNIELLACGGVDTTTIKDYFKYGASAVAFGGSIFNLEQLANKEYTAIKVKLLELIKAYWETQIE